MEPRDDDKGNYDDTQFPADSDNAESGQTTSGRATDLGKRADSDDEGEYDDKDQ